MVRTGKSEPSLLLNEFNTNDSILTKEMKMMKNRISAKKCRDKKKKEKDLMEEENVRLKQEIFVLKKDVMINNYLERFKEVIFLN